MIIPNDYAQVNLRFTGNALPTAAEMTLGLNVELFGGTPLDAAEDIALAFTTANLDNFYTTSCALTTVLVKFGPNATGPSAELGVSMPGDGAVTAVPPNTAALIQKQTGSGGRTGRGRMYFPAVPEAQVDEAGTLSTTWVDGLTAGWEAFRIDISGDGLVPTLLHGPDSPISAPMLITGFSCSTRVATQRRRLRR